MSERRFAHANNPPLACSESVILLPFGRRSYLPAAVEALAGEEAKLSDTEVAGAGDQRVFGCFVTLRRQGRLRGCCGFIGREVKLTGSVAEATLATATRDVRMPTISPTDTFSCAIGLLSAAAASIIP